MVHFVEYFNPRPGATGEQIAEAARKVSEGWGKYWPSNVDLGLYRRKYGIGAGPMYYWAWELPNIAAVKEWDERWDEADEVREAVDELMALIDRESWFLLEKV